MVRCPRCGKESGVKPDRSWRFRNYDVNQYTCPACGGWFRTYSSPGKRTWTIPKAKA